jgi:hypothetical protein
MQLPETSRADAPRVVAHTITSNGESMTDFALVDLYSQRQEVADYVTGWSLDNVINWLESYGIVQRPNTVSGRDVFLFRSLAGLETYFYFSEDNRLVVFDSGWLQLNR